MPDLPVPHKPLSRKAFMSGFGLAAVAGATVLATQDAAADEPPAQGEEVFNVKDYGARGDYTGDESAAFTRALQAIQAAGRGVLYVPPGDYRFEHRVEVSAKLWFLRIAGAGEGVSNLVSVNDVGIIKITSEKTDTQITIHDISLFAAHDPHAGTAIEIFMPGKSNNHFRSLTMNNVEIRPLDPKKDHFDIGLNALNQSRPLITNVVVGGPHKGGVNQDRSDDSLLYAQRVGMLLDGAFAPQLQNCYIWSAFTGMRNRTDENPGPEGTFFYNCFIVATRVGIDVGQGGREPGMAIDRTHVNSRDVGIRIRKADFSITNCLLYNSLKVDEPDAAPTYVDIELQECIGGIISDNVISQSRNNNRTAISVGDSREIFISDNYFNNSGTAISTGPNAVTIAAEGNHFSTEPDPRWPDTPRLSRVLNDPTNAITFATASIRNALVTRTSDQSVAPADWTTLGWQSETLDRAAFFDPADPTSFTVPRDVGVHFVRVSANVAWSDAAEGWRQVELCKNGTPFPGGASAAEFNGAEHAMPGGNVQNVHSAVVAVSAGDQLSVRVRHTARTALKVTAGPNTWFAVEAVNG